MTRVDIYAFDCSTTNWRVYRLHGEQGDDGMPPRPGNEPQRVALSTFAGAYLPAAVLLDEQGQLQSYGANCLRTGP